MILNIQVLLTYGITLSALMVLSWFSMRSSRLAKSYVVPSFVVTVVVVGTFSLVGVAINILPLTLALVVLSEEWARWWIVKRRPETIRRRTVALFVGVMFGLIETTNWLFVDKANTALAGLDLPAGGLVAADVAYICVEFLAGVIVHGGLTAFLLLMHGKDRNPEKLMLGVMLTTGIHFLLNMVVFTTAR
jgi:hypothetical protein